MALIDSWVLSTGQTVEDAESHEKKDQKQLPVLLSLQDTTVESAGWAAAGWTVETNTVLVKTCGISNRLAEVSFTSLTEESSFKIDQEPLLRRAAELVFKIHHLNIRFGRYS